MSHGKVSKSMGLNQKFNEIKAGSGNDIKTCEGLGCIYAGKAPGKRGGSTNKLRCWVNKGRSETVYVNSSVCLNTEGPVIKERA